MEKINDNEAIENDLIKQKNYGVISKKEKNIVKS